VWEKASKNNSNSDVTIQPSRLNSFFPSKKANTLPTNSWKKWIFTEPPCFRPSLCQYLILTRNFNYNSLNFSFVASSLWLTIHSFLSIAKNLRVEFCPSQWHIFPFLLPHFWKLFSPPIPPCEFVHFLITPIKKNVIPTTSLRNM
jgi:hypothetical protein